jgi:hypothetical protein
MHREGTEQHGRNNSERAVKRNQKNPRADLSRRRPCMKPLALSS